MLIDQSRPVVRNGATYVLLDDALQAHTGVQFMTDPAVLAALLDNDEYEAFTPSRPPPLSAFSEVRIQRIQSTPRLFVEVPQRYIVSGSPARRSPKESQS